MPKQNFARFKDALHYALVNYESPNGTRGKNVKRGEALKHLARELIEMALNAPDRDRMIALKELIDRLDGKPMQSIGGVEGEPLTVIHRVIQHTGKPQVKEIDITPDAHTDPKQLN